MNYDDIKPGAEFLPEDFSDPYFMPGGVYEKMIVLEVGDDEVQVQYVGRNEYDDTVKVIPLEQLYQMLGLEQIGDNPLDEEAYVGSYAGVEIYARKNLSVSKAAVYSKAINSPNSLETDGWEHVSGLRIKNINGEMKEIHVD